MLRTLMALALTLLAGVPHLAAQSRPRVGTGLAFDAEKAAKVPEKAPLTRGLFVAKISPRASLKQYCPVPGNQGEYGMCTAWSTNYGALTILVAQASNRTDPRANAEGAFSPAFSYSMIKQSSDVDCSQGSTFEDALGRMTDVGAVPFKLTPQLCGAAFGPEVRAEASKYRIQDFARIFSDRDPGSVKIEKTKAAISEGKPVPFGMLTPQSFLEAWGEEVWTPAESGPEAAVGGHAMCVIGYDDQKYGGAFEILNSWGDEWGDDGYIWVKYTDYGRFAHSGYEIIAGQLKPQPVETVDMKGAIRYVQANGQVMLPSRMGAGYQLQGQYKAGSRFRIYVTNFEPAFVYAIGADERGGLFQLFPYDETVSPALTYARSDVALPGDEAFIELDENPGKEHLVVLYSKTPLNLEQVQGTMRSTQGTLEQKVRAALGTQLVLPENIQWQAGQDISFSAKSKGKAVLAVYVSLDHI